MTDDDDAPHTTEKYIDRLYRFNKDKAFDYVIGLKDAEDKILDKKFDDEDETYKT